MIFLYNTLNKKKEKFNPIKAGAVSVYSCGPTVYDRQHIGNMRSAVIWDILRRVLEFEGFKTKQVINITDFGHLTSDSDNGEDKMVRGLKRENLPFTMEAMKTLARKYADLYFEDRKKINALKPAGFPFASDFIKEDIGLIKKLEERGFIYKISDGIYFDAKKFENYGRLGGLPEEEKSRVTINPEKKNQRDFVLWKFSNEWGWNGPWGKGFPGWHIECSAIILKFFTDFFSKLSISENQRSISNQRKSALIDIHTGGIEHIPIHHNNEIAQTEAATGKTPSNYWLHNEHLILQDGTSKMAKSAGNVITLKEIEEKGFEPLALRLLYLQANYRSQLMFSWEALQASQNALQKLRLLVSALPVRKGKAAEKYISKFKKIIGDDLDTPKALALLWELLRDEKISEADKKATVLEFDKVLGLNLGVKVEKVKIPAEIKELAGQREQARKNKNWDEADRLRKLVAEKGFKIEDTSEGPVITANI